MRPRRSLWLGFLAAGLVVAAFFWLAPPQLGGSTIFSATVGNSMEPMFHKGDLALVRPSVSYNVGDIVLYESPVLHRPVLHRILVIQGAKYYFKGDNNDFVDPGYVTRDELLGKLWIHLPKVGVGLSFIGKPSHAGGLAGLAVLALLLGGSKAERKRRRGRRATPGWRPPAMKVPAFPHLRRPRRTVENIAAGAALTLGVIALVVGFSAPLGHMVPLTGAYDQTGSFSYSSTLSRPDAAYPNGTVSTGQPVFLTDFESLRVAFDYRFASKLPHQVRGTLGLKATLSSETPKWSRTYVLQAPTSFTGDAARSSGTLDLHTLRALTHQLAIVSGTSGTAYAVTLLPTVRLRGTVSGTRVAKTFAPTLPFDFSDAVLALNIASPATLPGATYDPPSTATTNETALEPILAGTIPTRAPNTITILKPQLAVSALRGLGLALTGLALLVLFTKPLRKKRETWSHEKRIAFRFGCVIVDVVSLDSAVASSGPPTALPDFASLASFARYLERPILHDVTDGTYATEDNGRLYVFRRTGERATAAPAPARTLDLAPRIKASATQPRPARRRRTIASVISALFAVTIAVGLLTSFTATNTVPMSRAGVSKWPVNVNQVASPYCSSIVLTKQVIATTASVTGTTGNDLVLGRNATGTQAIAGSSGDDCIIGGGGTGTINNFDGGAGTDICIGAPRATNTFTNCEYNGTLPAANAVSFSDWENVSGNTLASITTGTAATSITGLDAMETPIDRGDNLGSRLQALVTAPATGAYTFWIASDDNGRLYLSTSSDAAGRKLIASVDNYTTSEAWDTYPSQKSTAVSLVAGQKYYVEAWAKEAGGGDNLAVAWSGPGITRQVLSGDYLSAASTGCSGWCPTDSATPYHALLQSFSGQCADVNGASQTVGTTVIQYSCGSGSNQAWTLASNGSLQVYGSPRCLAPKGASLVADTAMVISACDASASQTWTFTAATGQLKAGGLCLEVPGANTAAGTQLTIDTCDGSPEQYWSFVATAAYTPDAPSIVSPRKAAVTGTSCADCTVKIYKTTGAVGATGPTSTLVGTVTATATGTFTFAPGSALAVGNVITATATTPLGVLSGAATNVATTA